MEPNLDDGRPVTTTNSANYIATTTNASSKSSNQNVVEMGVTVSTPISNKNVVSSVDAQSAKAANGGVTNSSSNHSTAVSMSRPVRHVVMDVAATPPDGGPAPGADDGHYDGDGGKSGAPTTHLGSNASMQREAAPSTLIHAAAVNGDKPALQKLLKGMSLINKIIVNLIITYCFYNVLCRPVYISIKKMNDEEISSKNLAVSWTPNDIQCTLAHNNGRCLFSVFTLFISSFQRY